jgi:hypothetical protein
LTKRATQRAIDEELSLMTHNKKSGACITSLGIVALRFGSGVPADVPAQDTHRLVVDCPLCGRSVPYPGVGQCGANALAECESCDVYFEFDADKVRAPESIGCDRSPSHPVQHHGHQH